MDLKGVNLISYQHPDGGTIYQMEGCYLNTQDARHTFLLSIENLMMSHPTPQTEPEGV